MGPQNILFPDPDIISPLAIMFARMMFAHAQFEQEVRILQGAITNDRTFGEQRRNQWGAKERPKKMAKLIKAHLGTIPEAREIAKILTDAKPYCERRDFLAHGIWWRYSQKTSTITVRGGSSKKGPPHMKDYTETDIAMIVGWFKAFSAELYKLRAAIEHRRGDHDVDEHGRA